MNKKPLVSIIIATKNEEMHIIHLLGSLKKQTYKNIEIILVDNFSEDKTVEIVKKWKVVVYIHGKERSEQRNFGAKKAKGKYFLLLDADMLLGKNVIEDCVTQISGDKDYAGVIIPEKSIGKGFWAKCKTLEKSFYVGVSWIEAARFYRKDIFEKIHGYDSNLISGEDFDLSQRAARLGNIGRVKSFILHDEGKLNLFTTSRKKFYYAKYYGRYTKKWDNTTNKRQQVSPFSRYSLYFSQPEKLFAHPWVGLGMLFMKTIEFFFGGLGYIWSNIFNYECNI